jgi:hypothetical protein
MNELFRALYLEASYQVYRQQSRDAWAADRWCYDWRPYTRREIGPTLETVRREAMGRSQ